MSWIGSRRHDVPEQVGAAIPMLDPAAVPWLSVEQMREVDRLLVDELGITLEQLMENAGRNLALLARLLLGGDAQGRTVVVLAGPGGNGGGAMVAARHLAVAGAQVHVLLAQPPARLAPVPGRQHEILRRMGLDVQVDSTAIDPADLVVDGLLGYSQAGPPRDRTAWLIQATAGRRVLALDVPSGLELATGRLHSPHVVAAATLTLAAPKTGLRAPGAPVAVGPLYLADISVPPLVWARLGLPPPSPFGRHTIARIATTPAPGAR